jgi:NAD(P)H dehydrogenase (quinone)
LSIICRFFKGSAHIADVGVLIAFYSRAGLTEALAKAIADGAERQGAEVRLRRAREFVGPEIMAKATGWAEAADVMNERYPAPSAADAEWADAIVFGTPTFLGNVKASCTPRSAT